MAAAEKAYTGPKIDKVYIFKSVSVAFTNCILLQVHNCLLCEAKEGRNLSFGSGLMELRNHYSVCLYNRGQFTSVADPGEGNKDFEGKAVDEYVMEGSTNTSVRCQSATGASRRPSQLGSKNGLFTLASPITWWRR